MLKVRQVVDRIEKLVPPRLARARDPVGLQAGSPDAPIGRVMTALDASPATVRQALLRRAGLLVTHHPLIYQPLSAVDPRSGTGKALSLALSRSLAVYCAHTNLDAAEGGMNHVLADRLKLSGYRVLEPSPCRLFKLVVFVPVQALAKVKDALFSGGAGRIGAYARCSFSVAGTGTFLPGPGTRPAVGRRGREVAAPEVRLETVVGEKDLPLALSSLRAAHPYEEPAVDVLPLHATGREEGLGLCGDLMRPRKASELVEDLMDILSLVWCRIVGDAGVQVRRMALCTGSGGSLLPAAAAAGAQLYLTGDVGYHTARLAEDTGMILCDMGHYPAERFGMERFARKLGQVLRDEGVEVVMAKEEDPFRLLIPGGRRERGKARKRV